ncbi:MAG TPA: GGDEF domain-containing protein, partial [Thermoanaerobaculia bacterium]|nr:GGDEF domain-containing protein [Thermoanaerobaculia bacterium]
ESPAGGVLAGRFPARRRIALLVLLALLGARAAMAGRDAARPLDLRDLGAPSFTSFTPRDGVPDSVVTAIASGRDGFVWLASPLGLARYDGHRWEAVAAREASGQLGDLFVDHAGTLWAAFDDRGIASFDGARWHLENRASGLPSDHFHRVVETKDAAGRIETWALSGDAGLLRRDGGRWQPDPGNGQLPVGPLNGIAKTRDIGGAERLWVATYNEGLWYRENGGRWTRLLVTGFDPGQVDDLLITRSHGREELWIATYGLGLWRLTRDGLQLVGSELPDPPPSIVYALAASGEAEGDRVVWAATRGGLVRVHGDAVQVFDQRHGLPSSVIRNLHVGKSPGGAEVLWLATERGVARTPVGSTPWRTASLMGAGGNGVFGVLVEPDGRGGERLWVAASHDGVGLYEDGRWRRFDERDGSLPSSNVRLVTRVPDETGGDALWIGFTGGELVRVHEGTPGTFRFERIATPWPKHEGQAVTDLFARNTGGRHERWVATRQSGIWCFSDGRWTSFRPDRVVGQWRISKFAEQLDRDGRSWIWATTNQGLARWDGTVWTLLGAEVGLPDLELLGLTLMPDEKGRPLLWVGTTRNGLLRMDVSDPKNPEILSAGGLPKPPNPSAYNAQRDSKGRIYVCTNNGVQLLVPDGRGGFRERVFTRGDGLVHEECNNNAQRIDAHDRYWMGNLGGLSVYDPAELSSRPHAAPLRLTHVRIDGADVDPAAVRLRPTARELRVEFALLSWQREAESLFRSR